MEVYGGGVGDPLAQFSLPHKPEPLSQSWGRGAHLTKYQ